MNRFGESRERARSVGGRPVRVLVACRWPLGGIRTYLSYLYQGFTTDRVAATVIACQTREVDDLAVTMARHGHRLVIVPRWRGRDLLWLGIALELVRARYDVIHSQGFISGFHVCIVNWLFRKAHVMTVHGIVEERYVSGRLGRIRRSFLRRVYSNVSIVHGVGADILKHVKAQLPIYPPDDTRWVAVPNGIEPGPYRVEACSANEERRLRRRFGVSEHTIIFGFFGRFMPQKGFDYLVDATAKLLADPPDGRDVALVAFGSGDYEREYRRRVAERGLEANIRFMPHTGDVAGAMKDCDAVVMPSIWEAWGLVACEVLCSGVPLIASDCIGLREVTAGTPATIVPARDSAALADAMRAVVLDGERRREARAFAAQACDRYDVQKTRDAMELLFRVVVGNGRLER